MSCHEADGAVVIKVRGIAGRAGLIWDPIHNVGHWCPNGAIREVDRRITNQFQRPFKCTSTSSGGYTGLCTNDWPTQGKQGRPARGSSGDCVLITRPSDGVSTGDLYLWRPLLRC